MTWHPEYGALFVAVVLGLAVGWERSLEGKPAGYRTHALVALGGAGMVLAARIALEDTGSEWFLAHVVAAVVTSIGFLGAGAILQSKRSVRGLTTAASVWIVAIIGVVCGLGQIALATIMALLAWIVLRAFVRIEEKLFPTPVRNAEGAAPMRSSPGKSTQAED